MEKDAVYVGGGNTKSLLALWKEWNLDIILKQAYENGKLLGGISAGSICWFEEGVTDSIPGSLTPIKALGLLKGSNCPHYDGETERRPAYHRLLQNGGIGDGLAADDGVALHFRDGELYKVVSSREMAKAYRVTKNEGIVNEEILGAEFLLNINHDLVSA